MYRKMCFPSSVTSTWNKIVEEWGAEYDAYGLLFGLHVWHMANYSLRITSKGSVLYLRTNHTAPQYKVITVDVSKNNSINELISESDAFMSSILSVNKDYFAVVYKRNVCMMH